MYRISDTLSGERARINHWIYERTIINTLSNLIGIDWYNTDVQLSYKTDQISCPAQITSVTS